MKILNLFFIIYVGLVHYSYSEAQVVNKQINNIPAGVIEKPDLKKIDTNPTPEFKATVSTWSAGKISASQAVISYSIRIDDTTQPMEHGVCYSTSSGPTISNPKTTAKGYTTYTLYGELNGLKPGIKYYVKAYMKLLNYPDRIYYGNEINFSTLAGTTK